MLSEDSFIIFRSPGRVYLDKTLTVWTGYAGANYPKRMDRVSNTVLLLKAPSVWSQHVFIVYITEEDYENDEMFEGTSPLNRNKVYEILQAIVRAKPRVIGVDLDTSSKRQALSLPQSLEEHTIIWARDATLVDEKKESFQAGTVLSGAQLPLQHCAGIVLLPANPDSVLRYYRRQFKVEPDADQPEEPYLCRVARVSQREPIEPEECRQTRDAYPWAIAKA